MKKDLLYVGLFLCLLATLFKNRTITIMNNIHPSLVNLSTDLKGLKLLEGNPRKGDVNAVAKSYEQYGQRKPIVINRDGMILAGNHQYQAAVQLGWDSIAAVVVDDDEATGKAYSLADNRTHDIGHYDWEALVGLIDDVNAVDDTLYTGYDQDAIDDLVAFAEEAAEEAVGEGGHYGSAVQGKSMSQLADEYQNRASRVFLADLPNNIYIWFIENLIDYREKNDIESNAEAIVHLLNEWSETDAPGWE